MATEFNYRRAWQELANPQYEALPDAVKEAYRIVATEGRDLQQDKHLLVPVMPKIADLLAPFDTGDLCLFMKVIYNWGHWAYTDIVDGVNTKFGPTSDDAGAYWKLENMIRQIIVDMPNPRLDNHESAICHKYGDDHPMLKSNMDGKFMDHKPGTDWSNEELPGKYQHLVVDDFHISEVRCVNFKPHPFMIGPRHFPGDGEGSYILPRKAPCAMRGCCLDYDEHTHDVAMFLKCKRQLPNKEAAAALMKLKNAFEEDKVRVDGFAFLKGEFTIDEPLPGAKKE